MQISFRWLILPPTISPEGETAKFGFDTTPSFHSKVHHTVGYLRHHPSRFGLRWGIASKWKGSERRGLFTRQRTRSRFSDSCMGLRNLISPVYDIRYDTKRMGERLWLCWCRASARSFIRRPRERRRFFSGCGKLISTPTINSVSYIVWGFRCTTHRRNQ